MTDLSDNLRLVEALLFASAAPLAPEDLARHLPEDADLDGLLQALQDQYAERGVRLVRVGRSWAFRTAEDLAPRMGIKTESVRKLSRAAVEVLAIIAYHQPMTRAEIEEIRGVALSRGTLDTLLEAGWVRPKGRRRTPGRPVTWGTTEAFLDHFGLESLDALPGLAELKAAGLLDSRPAIAALSAGGKLARMVAGDDEDENRGTSGDDAAPAVPDDEEAIPLAADFGEDLMPADGEAENSDQDARDRA